jgi:hypothetical protein
MMETQKPWTGVRGIDLNYADGRNPHNGRDPDLSDSVKWLGASIVGFGAGT